MPSTYLYADPADAAAVVDAVLGDQRLEVWEAASPANAAARRAMSLADYRSLVEDGSRFVLFTATMGSPLRVRRIALRSNSSEQTAFRELVEGWGVIHLQFRFDSADHIWESRVACNSAARAFAWADTLHDELGSPQTWNWPVVRQEYRRVVYLIRKLSVRSIGGALALPSIAAKTAAGHVRLHRELMRAPRIIEAK
jgi:hypothetical protein